MIKKLLDLFDLVYSKRTTDHDYLNMVGYSYVVIKLGKRIITYRQVKGMYKMVQYVNGITEYSLLKEYKND